MWKVDIMSNQFLSWLPSVRILFSFLPRLSGLPWCRTLLFSLFLNIFPKHVTAENRAIKWRQRIPKKYFFEKVKPMIITVMRCGFLRCLILCFIFLSLRMPFLKDFLVRVFEKKDNWVIFSIFVHFQKLGKWNLEVGWIWFFFLNERYWSQVYGKII